MGIVIIPGTQLHQHCLPILRSVNWMTVTGSDVRINSALTPRAVTRLRCGPAPQHSAVVLTQWCNEIRVRIRDNSSHQLSREVRSTLNTFARS